MATDPATGTQVPHGHGEAHVRFERLAHEAFEGAIRLKGLFALIEVSASVALGLIGPMRILHLVARITAAHPLGRSDWLASGLVHAAEGFSVQAAHFFAVYLFAHGMVKLALVLGLFRRKRWAYPTAIVVMSMFVTYQLWRFDVTHGLGLLALSVFDALLVTLIWREWRRLPASNTT